MQNLIESSEDKFIESHYEFVNVEIKVGIHFGTSNEFCGFLGDQMRTLDDPLWAHFQILPSSRR